MAKAAKTAAKKKAPAPSSPATASGKGSAKSGFLIKIQNIVAYTVLDAKISLEDMLKKIEDTEWQPEQFPGLIYKIKDPRASALIFSQGKVVCTGTKTSEDLRLAMKKIVSKLRGAGVKISDNYETKVQNIVASTKLDGNIELEELAATLENAEYEPEQFPGLVYRISEPRVAFLIFSSGRVIIAGAQNEESIYKALERLVENLGKIGVKVKPSKEL
jgi:transcription initiation factor TFIID TATA-box-binding protein